MTVDTLELDFDQFTLTTDQQAASDAIYAFLADPIETVFVLQGYSGCGKSTLVRMILDRLPRFMKTLRLINPSATELEVELSATTNKAAENLGMITGYPAKTIHSLLGLRVNTDFKTGKTTLIPRAMDPIEGKLLFIDEASYVDHELLPLIFQRTRRCKIIFVGDPAQLVLPKSKGVPVFEAKFPGASLKQVVRQPVKEGKDGELVPLHPIVAWSEQLRNTVETGVWTPFTPDGFHIQRLDRDTFNARIEQEFTRPNWRYTDSKILAWTNKCVIGFNQFVRGLAKGDPNLQVDDYAVCNSYLQVGKDSIKTDQLVHITAIEPESMHYEVRGRFMTLDYRWRVFQPSNLADAAARIKRARIEDDIHTIAVIENSFADLRGAAAQTINKAQGSTYESVYIDLDDIGRCHQGDSIARMLYVGASRARNHVYLTGDLA